jgi:iron uptake system EfeUOB component EfeO/EfeM
MKDGISQTLTSVKSGDFAAAQTSFGTLQTSWGEIEGDIKKLSGDTHAQIQSGMDTVEADLKAQSPDGTKIAANLESLTGSIGSLTGETADAKSTLDPSKTAAIKGDTATGGGNLTDTSVASNLSAMKTALAETTTAVESADFATAKTTFADARQSWFKFGGSVKQTSADTYQSIDDGVKTVNGAINGAAPSADTLLTDLGSLSKSLDEVTP